MKPSASINNPTQMPWLCTFETRLPSHCWWTLEATNVAESVRWRNETNIESKTNIESVAYILRDTGSPGDLDCEGPSQSTIKTCECKPTLSHTKLCFLPIYCFECITRLLVSWMMTSKQELVLKVQSLDWWCIVELLPFQSINNYIIGRVLSPSEPRQEHKMKTLEDWSNFE